MDYMEMVASNYEQIRILVFVDMGGREGVLGWGAGQVNRASSPAQLSDESHYIFFPHNRNCWGTGYQSQV